MRHDQLGHFHTVLVCKPVTMADRLLADAARSTGVRNAQTRFLFVETAFEEVSSLAGNYSNERCLPV